MEKFTASKIFFYFCLCFIFGVFLNSLFVYSLVLTAVAWVLFIFLIFVLVAFLKKIYRYSSFGDETGKKLILVSFCLVFMFLGVWRHQSAGLKIKDNKLWIFNDLEAESVIIGSVVREPDIREKIQKLTIKPEKIVLNGIEYSGGDFGKILVSYKKYPKYRYGDRLKIVGKLESPQVFEGFNYKNYLLKNGIYSVIYFSKIELLAKEKNRSIFSFAFGKILDFKEKLRKSVYSNFPPSQSFILGAMILGDKSRIAVNLKEKLNIAGVRHIIAVSGLHITIISAILMSLFLALGFYRSQAFYFSIVLIVFFIIMIGAHASALRAGIMGGLYLLGQKIGRKSSSLRGVMIAAAFMIFLNPFLLLNDVGFQLSFLAVAGIIYLKEPLDRLLNFIKINWIKNITSLTLSAQIFTMPILIYNFGRISLVAPLANVLILPLVPFIMTVGFALVLLGTIWSFGAWLLSLFIWPLLAYFLLVVDFFSLPWMAKTIENVHWVWLLFSYFILGYIVWLIKRKSKPRFLNY